jgi:hypothetical protein
MPPKHLIQEKTKSIESRSNEPNQNYQNNAKIITLKQKITKLFLWKPNSKISNRSQLKHTKKQKKKIK